MKKVFKVGLIGGGKIVENSHLPVLKNLEDISVDWVFDVNNDRSQLLSKMYQVQPISDWEKKVSDIDICLVTIPYGVRKDYLQVITSLNKYAYVEKPFALTVKEHTDMAQGFLPYGLAIGFQRRAYKIVTELNELIKSDLLGKLKFIDFKQGYFTLKGGGSYLGNAELSGGGVLIESAIHSLDQILLITAATDVKVNGATYIQRQGIDYDSTVSSTLFSPFGNIEVSTEVSTLQNLENGLTLHFERGSAKCKLSTDAQIKITPENGASSFYFKPLDTKSGISYATSISSSFSIFWQLYIEALINKQQNITSAQQSLLTTKWIEEIYGRFK